MSTTQQAEQASAALHTEQQQRKHQDDIRQARFEADNAKEHARALRERNHRLDLMSKATTVEEVRAAANAELPQSKPKPFDPAKLRRTFTETQAEINTAMSEGLKQRAQVGTRLRTLVDQGRITREYALEQMQASEESNNIIATLDAAIISAEAQMETAKEHTSALRAEHLVISDSDNPTEQLLAETRAQRAWDRIKAELDKRDDLQAMKHLGVVLKDADKQTRAIIMQEAPSYFTTHREYVNAEEIIELHLRAAVPELHDAHQAEAIAEKHYMYVNNNVKRVRERLATNPFDPPSDLGTIAGFLKPEQFGK